MGQRDFLGLSGLTALITCLSINKSVLHHSFLIFKTKGIEVIYFIYTIRLLFICSSSRNTKRKERSFLLIHSPDACSGQGWIRNQTGSQEHSPGLACTWQEPIYLSLHCYLAVSELVESSGQEPKPESNSDMFSYGMWPS